MLKRIISGLLLFLFLSFFNPVYGQQLETTLDPWQESSPVIDSNHRTAPLPSFAVNKRYYVHTDLSTGLSNSERILYVADQQADGSLGPWRVATEEHGGGPHGYTAITAASNVYHFRNGHIAQYIIDESGNVTEIKLLEADPNTSFGGNKYVWDTTIFVPFDQKKFIFHLGGYGLPGSGYLNDLYRIELPINSGSSFTKVGLTPPSGRPYKAAFYKVDSGHGYIYLGNRDSQTIYKAGVDKDGNVGSWQEAGTAPNSGNNLGDMFVIDNQFFIIKSNKVYQATIGPDGSLGSFSDTPPDLPSEQVSIEWDDGHPEGKNFAFIGDYVYVTGPDRVYYAKINRPGAATPTTTVTTKPGDANGDNLVDIRDFEILRQEFNKTRIIFKADFNNDGKVDIRDFEILRQNFNK